MAIEIVSFPINSMVIFHSYVRHYQRVSSIWLNYYNSLTWILRPWKGMISLTFTIIYVARSLVEAVMKFTQICLPGSMLSSHKIPLNHRFPIVFHHHIPSIWHPIHPKVPRCSWSHLPPSPPVHLAGDWVLGATGPPAMVIQTGGGWEPKNGDDLGIKIRRKL